MARNQEEAIESVRASLEGDPLESLDRWMKNNPKYSIERYALNQVNTTERS